ncbi:MAG TPA: restriction endonuclease subunit S [Thermoanaerobaculia bacterium]|nr:restriction endonuclease subunit S [Thermoanaerobaculia bacterium]
MSWLPETVGGVCLPTPFRNPRLEPASVFEYIDISGVDRERKAISSTQKILGVDAPSRARKEVAAEDVLVSTVRPNLNAVALVPEELDGAIASTGFCVLRANRKAILPRFLFFFSRSEPFIESLTSRVRGANYPAVADSDVRAAKLHLPALPEQRRIVEILDQADRLQKLRAEADTKGDAALRSIFGRILRDCHACTAEPLGQLLSKDKGALQSGPFGTHLHNSDFVEAGQVLVVGIDNVQDSGFDLGRNRRITAEKYSELRKFTLKPGDVLVTIMGSIGRTCVFPEKAGPAICSKHVYRIQVDRQKLHPDYLCDSFRFAPEVRAALGASVTGQIVAGITSASLRKLVIRRPPLPLQQEYAQLKKALSDIAAARVKAKNLIDRLFDRLLHRAFTGDLTASWREAHMKELLQEMEHQEKALASLGAGR